MPQRRSISRRQRPKRNPHVPPMLRVTGEQQHLVPLRRIEQSALHLRRPRRIAGHQRVIQDQQGRAPASCNRSAYAKRL